VLDSPRPCSCIAGAMAASAIAADAADLRQGAQGDDAGPKPTEEPADLSDDSDENEEPEKPPPPPAPFAKLYAIPRDYGRVVEVSAELEQEGRAFEKKVFTKAAGPDYGTGSASKFIHACKAAKEDTYFCVPYDARRVLSISMDTGVIEETGKTFRKDGAKYTEAVASTNSHGKMYAAPCRAQRLLEICSVEGTIKEIGPVLGSKKLNKWWAIHPSCGGRIYAIPYDAPRVLEIDPNRGTSKMVGPDLGAVKGKYCSVAEAPNGNLYCAPLNAKQVLEIDSVGKVKLVGPDFGDTQNKYTCMVTGKNKLIYAPPLYAERVLEINCARGSCREIGDLLGREAKYCSIALAPFNGKLYCPPLEARKVLEIDPDRGEVLQIGMDLGGEDCEKYSAICAAPEPSTKLYAAPRNAHYFLEICPRRAFVREVGNDHGRCPRKFSCIVPGTIWQGGMLWDKYKVITAEKEERYASKMARLQERRSSSKMSLKMGVHAVMFARRLSQASQMSGTSNRPSLAGSRSASKGAQSRSPSKK